MINLNFLKYNWGNMQKQHTRSIQEILEESEALIKGH